jgi:hypothetical protein
MNVDVAGSGAAVVPRKRARSAITSGRRLLGSGNDARSPWALRLADAIDEHIADLGGIDAVSAAERSIVRRAATLTVELERLEARFAAAGEASAGDLDLYQRTAGNLRRLLESVGLQRRARDVTPKLEEYLKSAPHRAPETVVDIRPSGPAWPSGDAIASPGPYLAQACDPDAPSDDGGTS